MFMISNIKCGPDGDPIRGKTRACPDGSKQIPGIDFDPASIAAPGLDNITIKTINHVTVSRGMHRAVVDVSEEAHWAHNLSYQMAL
jgi:hypothetical protein